MEQFLLVLAAVCSIGAIAAFALLLTRERQVRSRLLAQNAALRNGLDIRDREIGHLVSVRLPELLESLHNPAVTVSGPRHDPRALGPAYEKNIEAMLELVAATAERVRTHSDRSAKATMRAMMRAVQSLAGEQQLALSAMQERHDDPDVLAGLLQLDHMNAQLGRRAQATAVLCGSWPGQQRSASSFSDVVRGATSRIRDYLRIRVSSPVNAAVAGRVVEPVVLAVAELLDNAARHSQPDTSVEVNVQATHNGVAIVIDDAGVAMDVEELQHAARLLSGARSADVHRLGDPPQVGFAVAGVLAARYGFTVSVDSRSPYGGVRAVVFVPNALLADVPGERPAAPLSAPAQAPAQARAQVPVPMAAPVSVPEPGPVVTTAGGLPKRRRLPAAGPPAAEPSEASEASGESTSGGETAEPQPGRARATAAGLGAWQRGTRSGRAAATPDDEGKDPRP
ncbi:ATP-binding protein [Actinomadura barringtoniae]|uniref:histidine kinase n=1 Tax=Actinomadura barringtoniae TaxID=1427535 RepID=A0A939TGB0_9ACTN|nr:ATP-binding protein [Actinomadura barringtoniae]MBO2455245.1 ATP-binding protein [Actinomadura barringtoniae]